MKKFIIAILSLAILSLGAVFALAQKDESSTDKQWGKRGHHRAGKMHRRGGGMMLRGLDLSDEQKAQVKQIRESSKASTAPLREAAKANRQKMMDATANGSFDEATVTAIANEGAAIKAQLTVQRLKIKTQTFAILTDEQKAKAAEMSSKMKERRTERESKREARKAERNSDS
jgi:protein CpxP